MDIILSGSLLIIQLSTISSQEELHVTSNMLKVYYKIDEREIALLIEPDAEEGALLMEAKALIINANKSILGGISPSEIDIFMTADSSGPLSATLATPRTSSENPLLLKVAQNDERPSKKARISHNETIDVSKLHPPTDVAPPKASKPNFVCEKGWMDEVKITIERGLQDSDHPQTARDKDNDTLDRISPMAVVRCSRGGKTRFLYEIANVMKGHNLTIGLEVACLYASFNDYSSLEPWEQYNPLQALLRRVAFEAMRKEGTMEGGKRKPELFDSFLKKKPMWSKDSFLEWIGDTPCVLLIDELNNLKSLKNADNGEASEFCNFLKIHFIGKENRYLIFSSHLLGTLPFLSMYLDSSSSSSRAVELQALPLVPSMKEAATLNTNISSTREAVFYGLIPGMIYEAGINQKEKFPNTDDNKVVYNSKKNIRGKRFLAVQQFIENTSDFNVALKEILKSLITGDWDFIPKELLILLDSAPGDDGVSHKVRWVLFHLQYVLGKMANVSFDHCQMAEHLSGFCDLLNPKEQSGEGWEGLFVLFLVAYCLNGKTHDEFIPAEWFGQSQYPKVFLNGPYSVLGNRGQTISDCKRWSELKKGVIHGKEPQISILYPAHNSFEVYDVLVVYSVDGKAVSVYGYQLKEGKAKRGHIADESIDKSFLIQGAGTKRTVLKDSKGWTIPNKDIIGSFFGESGKHWTPERWKAFGESGASQDNS